MRRRSNTLPEPPAPPEVPRPTTPNTTSGGSDRSPPTTTVFGFPIMPTMTFAEPLPDAPVSSPATTYAGPNSPSPNAFASPTIDTPADALVSATTPLSPVGEPATELAAEGGPTSASDPRPTTTPPPTPPMKMDKVLKALEAVVPPADSLLLSCTSMARSSPRMSLPASLAGSPTEVSATVADGPPTASYIQMPEGSPEATPPPIPVTVPLVRPPAYSTTGGSRVTPTGFPLLTTPTSHTRTHLTIVFNFPHASKKPLKKSEAKKTTKPPRYTIVEPFYCTRTGLLQFINWNGSADEHQLCVNILSQCEVIDELYIGAPLTEDFKDAEFHELQRALGRVNTVRFSDIIRPTFTYPALQKVVGFFDIPRGPYVQLDDRRPEAHRDLLMSPLPPSVQYVCFVVTHAKGHTTAKHTVNATALKHCIGLQRVVLILDVADDAEGSKIHPRGTPKSGIGPFTPFIRSCAHLMPRTRLDLYGLEMWQPEWLYPPNEFPSGLEDQRAFIFFALMKLVHVVRREQGALGSFEDVRRAVNALKDPNNEAVLSIVSVMRLLSRASIEDQITSPSIVSGPSTLRHLYDGVEDNSPPPPPPT